MPAKCTPVSRICANCGRDFFARADRVAIGHGIYCSSSCFHAHFTWPTRPLEERFWEKVDRSGECWVWTASTDGNGYGQLRVGGRRDGRLVPAHRISYALTHGELPDELDVLHKCDNPPCVRPEHLFTGTATDNLRDAAAKGRTLAGERSYSAKLTRVAVLEIRQIWVAGGVTRQALADRFGVSRRTIGFILQGKTWRQGPPPRPTAD